MLNVHGAIAPPLGILNIAAVLEKNGYTVQVADFVFELANGTTEAGPNVYDDVARKIIAFEADVIGFSTLCASYPGAIQLSDRVKAARPNTKIVFGGMNAAFVAVETLEAFQSIDVVCRGEGELAFLDIVQALEGDKPISHVPGIAYRDGSRVEVTPDRPQIRNLDDLPLPSYHLAPSFADYAECNVGFGRTEALVEAGRGCSFNCMFCSICGFYEEKARHYSPERVVEEIELVTGLGADSIYFTYDILTEDPRYVRRICELLKERDLRVPWVSRSRLDLVDYDLIDTMVEAGCLEMFFGMESGSKKILASLHGKNIGEEHKIDYAREKGVQVSLSFTIGYPQENQDEVNATLMCCIEYAARGVFCTPLLISVLPGTKLYHAYKDRLVQTITPKFSFGIEYDDGRKLASDQAMIARYPHIFSSFYNIQPSHLDLTLLGHINYYAGDVMLRHNALMRDILAKTGRTPYELFGDFFAWAEHQGMALDRLQFTPLRVADTFVQFGDQGAVANLESVGSRRAP